jgi:hypothetical protein
MAHKDEHNVYYYREEEYQRNREFNISPPGGISEAASLSFKTNCISLHICSLVDQHVQTITSFKDFINIVNHNSTDLTDFTPHTIYSVCVWVIRIVIHLLTQDPRELIIHAISKGCQCSTAICLHEPSMDILKERKGDSPSGGLVGHAERGDAVGALGVEDVAVLRVGDVAVGSPAGEALEDLPRHGARVGRRRAVLRQHHRPARHHRVQDRHLRRAPRLASPPASGCRADAEEEEEDGGEGEVELVLIYGGQRLHLSLSLHNQHSMITQ